MVKTATSDPDAQTRMVTRLKLTAIPDSSIRCSTLRRGASWTRPLRTLGKERLRQGSAPALLVPSVIQFQMNSRDPNGGTSVHSVPRRQPSDDDLKGLLDMKREEIIAGCFESGHRSDTCDALMRAVPVVVTNPGVEVCSCAGENFGTRRRKPTPAVPTE